MSRIFVFPLWLRVGFPRVSGDEPVAQWVRLAVTWFSPRERG